MGKTKRYLRPNKHTSLFWMFLSLFEVEQNFSVSPYAAFRNGLILPHGLGGIHITTFDFKGVVVINQNVTIGTRFGKPKADKGFSEGFLYIGAGAFVSSDIKIGANVIIGANAVVTKDVPPNSTVVGANRIIDNNYDSLQAILEYYSKNILNENMRYWPNKVNSSSDVRIYMEISLLRVKYDASTSKTEIKQLQKEYKNLLSRRKVSLFQRLIWSKLYRFFTGKWLKTK